MSAPRQARAGISISAKLVLVSSIVVAAAVGVTTWFGQSMITELTQTQMEARRESGDKAIVRESELIARSVAASAAFPLGNSAYPDIKVALDSAMRDDTEKRLQWLIVTDTQNQIVQTAGTAPDAPKLAADEKLLAAGPSNGGVGHAKLDGTDWVYGATISLGTTPVGALRMGVSSAGLEKELATAISDAKDRAVAGRNRVIMVAAVVLAIGIVLAALQGVRLARPIRALTGQASRISSGDLRGRVDVNRGDELGVLGRTFNVMADEINHLLEEQTKKASLEKEMELAQQVQRAMLPPQTLDEHGYLKIVGYCQPASSCGGDWWSYRKLSNGRMLLVLGDATGHGIHSAMIAATARGAVEALSGIDERLLTPEQVLRAIDSAIRQVGDHNVLMTAFACVFDSTSGTLHYANAGQNFPYVIKLGPNRMLEQASIIAASGNPLGDRNIAVEIRRGSLQMKPGDLFVGFTDGVVERANPAGKLFGDRRLRSALTGQSMADASSMIALRDRLVSALDQYAEGKPADDDITVVFCQYDPPATSARLSGRVA